MVVRGVLGHLFFLSKNFHRHRLYFGWHVPTKIQEPEEPLVPDVPDVSVLHLQVKRGVKKITLKLLKINLDYTCKCYIFVPYEYKD